MKPATHPDSLRLQQALGPGFLIVEFEAGTRTSADAAAAIGCSVAQIAKSVLFRTAAANRPVLVIASGVNRIDEKKVAAAIGERIKSADPAYVLEQTGYAVGGVPPAGHKVAPRVVIDQDLAGHNPIWAAGGSAHAVFELTFEKLVALTGGTVAEVARLPQR